MSTPRFDVEMQLRRHGVALRQLAGELVRDPAAAEDAVQEVWLGVLRRPPQHDAALGGWFATALRNVVRGWGRKERRAARREQWVAAARIEVVEDHAAVIAREEQARQLLGAVTALDAPYREAIWQRYFESKAPREIAAASGVAVETVKSRLKRGLQQLREKLGEEGESDWRGALAVAFGLKEGAVPAGTAVTTATTWSGVLLMTAWTKSLAAVAVVAVAAMMFWSLRDPEVARPRSSEVVASGGPVALPDVKAVAKADRIEGAATERSEVKPVTAASEPKHAILRGRCVDLKGSALAGCEIDLNGFRSSEALERGPEELPPWRDPPSQSTGPDGTFRFEFLPHSTLLFRVDIDKPSFVAMTGDLSNVVAGANIDLGDVVLVAGVTVTGTVVDEAGKVVAKARVSVSRMRSQARMHAERQRASPRVSHQASTDDLGRFSLRGSLGADTYELRVSRHEVVQPQQFTVDAAMPGLDLAVVVHRPSDSPAITGRVVDDADRPVSGALVECEDFEGPSLERSDAEGRFTVRRRLASRSVSVHLSARHDGHEPTRSPAPLAWGTTDVVLRLQPSSGLTIRVTDASNAPVANYSVRVMDRGMGGLLGNSKRASISGPFENGTARLPDVQAGKWLVLVDFPAETKCARLMEAVDVTARGPNFVSLRAAAAAQRSLHVVHGDGSPAVGTQVQLCSLPGGEFGAATPVFREERWLMNLWKNGAAVVSFEGTSDASGRVMLQGPGGRDLGLRVLGPGHAPLVLLKIRLDESEELQVSVHRGARLVGQITPREIMADLRRRARLGPKDAFPAERGPSLRLRGADNSVFPSSVLITEGGGSTQFDLGSDGAFDLTGLPAGSWRVELVFWDVQSNAAISNAFVLGDVALADDVTTRLDPDLQSMLPGTLEGEVIVNGVPFANGAVMLQASHGTRADGQPDTSWSNLETDAQGHFTHHGRSGDYSASVTRPPLGPGATKLRALGTVTIVRGETTRHTFAVLSGTLRLKLLNPNGTAAAGVEVHIVDEGAPLPRTAADGTASAEFTAQNITLRVLPQRLQSQEAQNKAWNDARGTGQADPFAPHWLTLGTATIAAGQTTTLELRLPPEWEK